MPCVVASGCSRGASAHGHIRTQHMPELQAAAGHVSVFQVAAAPNTQCALKFLSLRHRGGNSIPVPLPWRAQDIW
jgi:hydroxyethylthiazole kinase-like sugar kinase family protein